MTLRVVPEGRANESAGAVPLVTTVPDRGGRLR
jgi:hypothetical protein